MIDKRLFANIVFLKNKFMQMICHYVGLMFLLVHITFVIRNVPYILL